MNPRNNENPEMINRPATTHLGENRQVDSGFRVALIGRTVKSKALQPAALHFGVDVTKFYETALKRKGRLVSGKLRLSYSYFVPDLWNPRTYICQGATTFTARPR